MIASWLIEAWGAVSNEVKDPEHAVADPCPYHATFGQEIFLQKKTCWRFGVNIDSQETEAGTIRQTPFFCQGAGTGTVGMTVSHQYVTTLPTLPRQRA